MSFSPKEYIHPCLNPMIDFFVAGRGGGNDQCISCRHAKEVSRFVQKDCTGLQFVWIECKKIGEEMLACNTHMFQHLY